MPEFDPKTGDLLTGMLTLAGLLVLVAIGIQVISVYRRRLSAGADDEVDLSESFREAYEAGELNTDEYRQIQATLDRSPAPPPPPISGQFSPPSFPAEGAAEGLPDGESGVDTTDPDGPKAVPRDEPGPG